MAMALIGLGGLFSLVTLVCSIVILIHAFRASTGTGFMCLCIPCYIIYYMFTKFEHPKKNLVIAGWWVGNIAGQGLQAAGRSMAGNMGSGRSF